jgi:hypothetical protein
MERYRPQPNKYDVEKISAYDAIERADRFLAEKPLDYQVGFLVHHLGPRVTAASTGITDGRELRRWMQGDRPDEDTQDRIRILSKVTYAITACIGSAAASGFIRSANPSLNDEAVLLLLREENPIRHEKHIIAATRKFLE